MKEKNIEKVLQVWNEKNSILNPNQRIKLEIIEQIASMFAAGPYYYFVFNFDNLEMEYVNERLSNVLGIDPSKFTINTLLEIMYPDDIAQMSQKEGIIADFLLNKISPSDLTNYKVSYLMRLKTSKGAYRTVLHQSRTINVSDEGKIQQVLAVHTDVSHFNIPFSHKISFLGQNRPSYYAIEKNGKYQITDKHLKDNFTKREKEIIKKLAEGKNYKTIAEELYIAPNTVNTHKRNILGKSECKNTAELIKKCISEGVI